MKLKKTTLKLSIVILFSIVVWNCSKDNDILYESPDNLDQTEFTFLPENPNSLIETNFVFYGCTYYETTSVSILANDINIRKHFNGQLKRACFVEYDTISLGKLKKGEYNVNLQIIDTNPFAQDSIFFNGNKKLIVSRK